jgi:hypothetical protein
MGLGRGVWDGGDAAMGGKLNEKRKLGQDRLCRRTLKIRLLRTLRTTQTSRNARTNVAEIQLRKTRFSHISRIAAPSA